MAEVHFLACGSEGGNGKKHKCYTKEEITDVAVLLSVYQQKGNEENWEYDVRHVERETKRHDPCRERGSNVGSHYHRYCLCQGKQSGIYERHRHDGGRC